ncbi:glycosyltransferase family 4 protein [Pedobacter aquae]|uniref:Glycosyltransferase family 4 protein n=1 Tax=Pedobacter aquae TaxID=2605747 RepID=A0A5C0VC41_9SPHI|nr:glycosyltransferase family 4 protein [Pedobacter aquae]QEK50325.1 glycosyltransferase family 4 protein [Pedobacter aquae]
MKCSVANPNIAPYIKQTVIAYQESNNLEKFYTTFFEHREYFLTKFLINYLPNLKKNIKRRNLNEIDFNLVKGKPFKELIRVFSARFLDTITTDKIWEWGELSFDQWVANQLDKSLSSIHTYEHAALKTLERAKELGILSFYEQPSQHHALFEKIVKEQLVLYPELKTKNIDLLTNDKAIKRNKRRDNELKVCDYIICNSTFTKKSLLAADIELKKIITIPYGFPKIETLISEKHPTEKISFMNAGSQNLRKGIHILFQAWKECNFGDKAELIMIGKNHLPTSFLKDLPENIKFIPNIPHEELMSFYAKSDVFVLPTLADGFGMVITEAMSRGMPVITTTHSGGPDIIEHKKNGIIIPPNDKEALIASLRWCVENKNKLKELGRNALIKADSYPWKNFRREVIKQIEEKIASKY